jgi:predicted Zn-dependent peptidase
MNATTGNQRTNYFATVPADRFDLALDVLADMLTNSVFPAEAFERERRVVFEELKTRNDDPSVRVFDEFSRLVFQVSPLRRDAGGYVETVATIPIETILAHRTKHYVTGNIAIAAVGNLQHDETVARIERAFAALPRGPRLERPRVAEPVQTEPRWLEVGAGTRRAEIRLGWPAPGDDDPDSPAMVVLQDILGTSGRRLTEEIRDRRALATSVGPSYSVFDDAGAFSLFASTVPDRVPQVIELLLAEIRRVRDGDVSEADVASALRAIAGRRAISQELNSSQVGRAALEVSGTLDSHAEFRARLRGVSPTVVQRAARTYLDPDNYTLVVVRA